MQWQLRMNYSCISISWKKEQFLERVERGERVEGKDVPDYHATNRWPRNPRVAVPSARSCCWYWAATIAMRHPGCFGCYYCYCCCYRLLRCQLVMQSTNQIQASVNVKEAFCVKSVSDHALDQQLFVGSIYIFLRYLGYKLWEKIWLKNIGIAINRMFWNYYKMFYLLIFKVIWWKRGWVQNLNSSQVLYKYNFIYKFKLTKFYLCVFPRSHISCKFMIFYIKNSI